MNERFVWGKKIEKQIQSGVDVKDLTAKAERRRQEERLVREQNTIPSPPVMLLFCLRALHISLVFFALLVIAPAGCFNCTTATS